MNINTGDSPNEDVFHARLHPHLATTPTIVLRQYTSPVTWAGDKNPRSPGWGPGSVVSGLGTWIRGLQAGDLDPRPPGWGPGSVVSRLGTRIRGLRAGDLDP